MFHTTGVTIFSNGEAIMKRKEQCVRHPCFHKADAVSTTASHSSSARQCIYFAYSTQSVSQARNDHPTQVRGWPLDYFPYMNPDILLPPPFPSAQILEPPASPGELN